MELFFPLRINRAVKDSILDAKLFDPKLGLYRLQNPFDYRIVYKQAVYQFSIPEDFITNFASVPRCFWFLFSPTAEHLLVASCVHDFVLNEFKDLQPELTRAYTLNGMNVTIPESIDGFLAADLFFASLSQEKSYNTFIRQFLRICVKGYYFGTLKGWFKVK